MVFCELHEPVILRRIIVCL